MKNAVKTSNICRDIFFIFLNFSRIFMSILTEIGSPALFLFLFAECTNITYQLPSLLFRKDLFITGHGGPAFGKLPENGTISLLLDICGSMIGRFGVQSRGGRTITFPFVSVARPAVRRVQVFSVRQRTWVISIRVF